MLQLPNYNHLVMFPVFPCFVPKRNLPLFIILSNSNGLLAVSLVVSCFVHGLFPEFDRITKGTPAWATRPHPVSMYMTPRNFSENNFWVFIKKIISLSFKNIGKITLCI